MQVLMLCKRNGIQLRSPYYNCIIIYNHYKLVVYCSYNRSILQTKENEVKHCSLLIKNESKKIRSAVKQNDTPSSH